MSSRKHINSTNGLRHHPSPRNARARGVQMTRASDVKAQKVVGLWGDRFYRGKVGLIAGEPGLGKPGRSPRTLRRGCRRRGLAIWRGHCSPRRRDLRHRGR